MIDLTNLKATGWFRVVAELNSPAGDDRAYFERLVRVLAQVSAARQAVLFTPDRTDGEEVEPRPVFVWPPASEFAAPGAPADTESDKESGKAEKGPAKGKSPGQPAAPGSIEENIENSPDAKSAARAAFSSGQARAFGLDKQEIYYDAAQQQGYLLAIPLVSPAQAPQAQGGERGMAVSVVAVATLLIEPRGKEAVRSTLAMAEVLAGYVHGHAARQALRRTQAASFALDLAARLIASVNTSKTFKGACIQFTNDLAKQFSLDRVALGWVKGDAVRVQAMSDVEHFDKRMAMVEKLQSAMDECLDQEQPIVFPPPQAEGPGGDVLLSQAIVHAHRELAAGNATLKVCSLPLRIDEEVVGVVTFESGGSGPIDLNTVEMIQAAMDLVAPVLRIRKSDDRLVAVRTWDATVHGAAWAVGSKHTVWKVAGVALLAVLTFVTFVHKTYRVAADATLEPRVKRTVSVPYDGQIRSIGAGIEPGQRVTEGQVLVELDTSELKLGLADAMAKIAQAHTQAAAAMQQQPPDLSKAKQAEAEETGSQAEADVYRYRIEKSRIVSPISGVIIAGEVKDRVGSTVKLGDPLLQIAPLDDMIVVAKVDDRDIAMVTKAFKDGHATGAIATKSRPAEPFDFTVERIVPLGSPAEGKNVFEVRAALKGSAAWLRPGMEGIAKFDTERHSLMWIGTRRIVETIRMWLW